jgi:hypothetical protein
MTTSIVQESGWKFFADRARPIAGVVAILSMVLYNGLVGKLGHPKGTGTQLISLVWLVAVSLFVVTLFGRPIGWAIGTVLRWTGGWMWVAAGIGGFFTTLGVVSAHFGTFWGLLLVIVLSPIVFSLAPFYMLWKDHDWSLILFYLQALVGWLMFAGGAVLCERSSSRRT